MLDRVRRLCSNEMRAACGGSRRVARIGAQRLGAGQRGGQAAVGKIDRQIKRLVDNGEGDFSHDPPNELTKNLLYYIAHRQPPVRVPSRSATLTGSIRVAERS
jgi:hypothetical protein